LPATLTSPPALCRRSKALLSGKAGPTLFDKDQGGQMSLRKNIPKCSPTLFFVKINAQVLPIKKVAQKFGYFCNFPKEKVFENTPTYNLTKAIRFYHTYSQNMIQPITGSS
jgi:hypothetical protein